jgi:hypothetical protein
VGGERKENVVPKRLKTGRFHLGFGLDLIEDWALQGKSILSEIDATTREEVRDCTPTECLDEVKRCRQLGFEVMPSPDCDNYDKTGRCLGHHIKK